jgi:hypothetical protein
MPTKTASKSGTESATSAGVRHYPIRYSLREYSFPTTDAIKTVRFDDAYIHIELNDERVLSIPLRWIPPLRDASPQAREQYKISEDRDALIWDPEESEVNEILRLSDYLTIRRPLELAH